MAFGWPSTTIRPSLVMSRPTEIMFVASATSTRSFVLSFSEKPMASRRFVSETLSVLSRDVSSDTSRDMARFAKLPASSPTRFLSA